MSKLSNRKIGGFPEKWPAGSIFENEGKRLYELVRITKPYTIIEVGTRYGCSTQHLALGCRDNGFGIVRTYDIENVHRSWPKELEPYIDFQNYDYFESDLKICDMLFEDGAHTTGFTKRVLEETEVKNIIAIHDAEHWDCINTVQKEALEVLGKPTQIFLAPPSDCGLWIYIK